MLTRAALQCNYDVIRYVLERSSQDHCIDQGATNAIGHGSSDGAGPQQRIERYGDILVTMGEVCAYSQPKDGMQLIMQ